MSEQEKRTRERVIRMFNLSDKCNERIETAYRFLGFKNASEYIEWLVDCDTLPKG